MCLTIVNSNIKNDDEPECCVHNSQSSFIKANGKLLGPIQTFRFRCILFIFQHRAWQCTAVWSHMLWCAISLVNQRYCQDKCLPGLHFCLTPLGTSAIKPELTQLLVRKSWGPWPGTYRSQIYLHHLGLWWTSVGVWPNALGKPVYPLHCFVCVILLLVGRIFSATIAYGLWACSLTVTGVLL